MFDDERQEKTLKVVERECFLVSHSNGRCCVSKIFPRGLQFRYVHILPGSTPIVSGRVHSILQGFDLSNTRCCVKVRSECTVEFFGRSPLLVPVVVAFVSFWRSVIFCSGWFTTSDCLTPLFLGFFAHVCIGAQGLHGFVSVVVALLLHFVKRLLEVQLGPQGWHKRTARALCQVDFIQRLVIPFDPCGAPLLKRVVYEILKRGGVGIAISCAHDIINVFRPR